MGKTTEICLWLFGKPEWEINLEKAKPEDLISLGENINERLENIAKTLKRLEENGWERSAGLYDIMLFNNITKKEAIKELKKIDISHKNLNIHEWDEKEFE